MINTSLDLNGHVAPSKIIRVEGYSPWTIVFTGNDGEIYHLRSSFDRDSHRHATRAFIAATVARAVGVPISQQQLAKFPIGFIHSVLPADYHSKFRIDLPESESYLAERVDGPTEGPLRPFSFLPETYVKHVINRDDFLGMYLFDIWAEINTARRVLFRRTGRNQEVRATFSNLGTIFSSMQSPGDVRAGCLCHQTHALYNGIWRTEAVQRWLKVFKRAIPASLPVAIRSLPTGWTSGYEDELQDRLMRRLETLPGILAGYSLPQFVFGVRQSDIPGEGCYASSSII